MDAQNLGADQLTGSELLGGSPFVRQIAFDTGSIAHRDALISAIDVDGMQERLRGTIVQDISAGALKIQLHRAREANSTLPQSLRDASTAWLLVNG